MIRTRPALPLLLASLLAAGCQRSDPPAALPALGQGDGRIEWQGVLPCADCGGIETSLVLERQGEARGYELVETFLAEEGDARFVESGRWRHEGRLIRLQGDASEARTYALLPDGRLQPRATDGSRFPPREGDFLIPVEATGP